MIFAEDREGKRRRISARYGGYWRLDTLRDFCYLTNPFSKPEAMVKEFQRQMTDLLCNYPSGQETQCLLAAEMFSCREDKHAVGNGASEIIVALSRLIEGTIGLFYPTFMEYPVRVGNERMVRLQPNAKELRYGAADLMAAAEKVDCMLLVNPDNPSGNFIPRDDLLRAVAHYRSLGKRMIVDESFVDFATDGGENGIITDEILDANPNLVSPSARSVKPIRASRRLPRTYAGNWRFVTSTPLASFSCKSRRNTRWNTKSHAVPW